MRRSDSNDSVENVVRAFSSDTESIRSTRDRRRRASEPAIGYSVNYDDLCGPSSFRENPAHARNVSLPKPRLCVWEFLTPRNIALIKRAEDENAVKLLLGNELRNGGLRHDIFLELAMSIIEFARDKRFTEESTSALVGIFRLTCSFFLSNPWRTARETHEFFYETILLHAVQDPPKSLEIFTPEECAQSLEFFSAILMNHLPLVRFVCLPNYCCIAVTGTKPQN